MTYTINFVRDLRVQEQKARRRKLFTTIVLTASGGILVLAFFYTGLEISIMRQVLAAERDNLNRIETEYRNYRETQETVTKAEVELLDRLQQDRVYWTKIIAAMARALPDYYWITSLEYKNRVLKTTGFGYITRQQKQLITIDSYLNLLRVDSTFAPWFPDSRLKVLERQDEQWRERVGFEFLSQRAKGLP